MSAFLIPFIAEKTLKLFLGLGEPLQEPIHGWLLEKNPLVLVGSGKNANHQWLSPLKTVEEIIGFM